MVPSTRRVLRADATGHEAEISAGRPGDVLWPFSVFHEVLRIAFFVPLVKDQPALERELQRLEGSASPQLRACADGELVESLLDLKVSLLDVGLDAPLAPAEGAYDRLFERIMGTEQPQAPPSPRPAPAEVI